MSKLYREPIKVKIGPNGMPSDFQWRRRWYKVTECCIAMEKVYSLKWWLKPEPPRYRCETMQGITCELTGEGVRWVLERVWD